MHDTELGPGHPEADECLPYYFQYIKLVPDGQIVDLLQRQITETAAFLAALTPEQALRREAPGEWNTLEIVGHVIDVERVFGYRALLIGRGDPVMWSKSSSPTTRRPPTSRRDRWATSWASSRPCASRSSRCCAGWTQRPGSGARRRSGPSAACAP